MAARESTAIAIPGARRVTQWVVFASVCLPAVCAAQSFQLDLRMVAEKAITSGMIGISHGVQLANGRFLFVDRRARSILAADLATGDVDTLGRIGEGPNEYRGPAFAVPDGVGGALVPDDALGRALSVSGTGELRGVRFSRLELGGANPVFLGRMNRDGSVYIAKRPPEGGRDSLQIVRWHFEAKPPKTVAWWPMVPVKLGPKFTGADGRVGQAIIAPSPWAPRTTWVALPNEAIAIVRPEPYRVDIVNPDGTRINGQAVEYQPVEIDAKMKAVFRKERGPIEDEDFPRALPRFEGLDDVIASDRNEIWVERQRSPLDSMTVYDIFDRTSRRVGTARLQAFSHVVGFGPGVVYVARQEQDDGYWYLERFRRP